MSRKKIRTFADYRDSAPRLVRGVLSLSRGGTGFVAPEGGGADVVVPEGRALDALPGDLVEIAPLPKRGKDARGEVGALRIFTRLPLEAINAVLYD